MDFSPFCLYQFNLTVHQKLSKSVHFYKHLKFEKKTVYFITVLTITRERHRTIKNGVIFSEVQEQFIRSRKGGGKNRVNVYSNFSLKETIFHKTLSII